MPRHSLLYAGFAALALAAVHAQTPARPATVMMTSVDPALFKGMQYRLVGPSRGGRVTTVTGVPSQPRTFYMGVASGGLFRTTDGGTTWAPITDGKVPVGSTGAVAVADSDPNIIYLGTGSDDVRSNVSTGRGIYKSTDGGETWKFMGLYDAGQIGAVAHPSDQSEHRVGRRAGRHVQGQRRARRFQDYRWRSDVEEGAVRLRHDRRDGCRTAARASGRRLRVDVAARAQAMDDHQRRPGLGRRGLLQEHRWRGALHENRRRACRTSSSAKQISRSPRRIRTASTRWSKRSRAADCIARMMPASRGRR